MNPQSNSPWMTPIVVKKAGLSPARPSCLRRALVPHLVAAAAELTPDAPALVEGSASISYAQLEWRANQLAGYLRSFDVGPEVPVGICLERGFDYVIAALAVWKAGGAYLPLDPSWPLERREFVLEDAGAPVVITRSRLAPEVRYSTRYVVDLDHDMTAIARESAIFSPPRIRRENLAYIIYTSGSTGRPKGVEVTHGNLLNVVFWHRRTLNVAASDRASHIAGLAFDASMVELWPYLSAGACIVVPGDARVRTSPDELREWLVAQRITIAFVPTMLAEPLIAGRWPAAPALRVLFNGGDTLHRHPSPGLPFRVMNYYGPTECTVVSIAAEMAPGEVTLPPLGVPVANTDIYLLDEHLAPVPSGATGEICIGGGGVARGYRNRRELTAASFVDDPFSQVPGARMYRTGDLGSLRPDGQIAFHGRSDGQEKIRGNRIETDEIATLIDRYPGVASCAVIAVGEAPDKRLVAYVVAAANVTLNASTLNASALREFLVRQLPDYMVPSGFVLVPELPLTANGKLDRAGLPVPSPANLLGRSEFREPDTPVRIQIAGLFSELLHVDRVGLDDNFFLLGGHSLLATRLIAHVDERFGVELGVRDLFGAQTVANLADEIERLVMERLDSMTDEEATRLLQRGDSGIDPARGFSSATR